MNFARNLSEQLESLAQYTYKNTCSRKLRRNDQTAYIYYYPNVYTDPSIYSTIFAIAPKSNHEKIEREVLKKHICEHVRNISALIVENIPALNTPEFYLNIDIRDPSKTGVPRFKIGINEKQLFSSTVTLPTIIKHFDLIRQHLSNVPLSLDRKFRINKTSISARDPYDAVRIYIALTAPKTFDTQPEVYPDIDVTEILKPQPFLQAVYSRS